MVCSSLDRLSSSERAEELRHLVVPARQRRRSHLGSASLRPDKTRGPDGRFATLHLELAGGLEDEPVSESAGCCLADQDRARGRK